jgi:hypothetical protein
LDVDIHPEDWPISEQWAYREVVGVNPAWAVNELDKVAREGDGSGVLALDTRYLLGFVWIAERRKNADLSFADLAERITLDELVDMVFAKAVPQPEAADPPLAETTPPPAPSSPTASVSSSSKPRAGRGRKSTSTPRGRS